MDRAVQSNTRAAFGAKPRPYNVFFPDPLPRMPSPHPCLYCGGTSFQVLHAGVADRLRYAPGTRDWLKCRTCGSGILFPFPAVEEIPGFYPPVYTFGLKQDKTGGALQQAIAQVEF